MELNNPLLDDIFLKQLNEHHAHEIYAKIIALNLKEYPIEEIQGKILSGSVNIDGHSAVRRTCSLSMITNDININEFYWGTKSKFQLFIGLKNDINPAYEDIIWFKQGVFVITDVNISKQVNNATISLQGKDKMCLLNGDVSGQVNALTDFGKLEEYNTKTGITTITQIKIKNIIREMIHAYGNEPWHNIFIKDVQDNGIELLDYINKQPLYAYIDNNNIIKTMTLDDTEKVYLNNDTSTQKSLNQLTVDELDPRISDGRLNSNKVVPKFKRIIDEDSSSEYTIAKITRGTTAGYRLTDLVYPGELVANIGESITSILDKIVKMLGPFEYFYDLDGHFIFQRQETYIGAPWSNLIVNNEERYIENAINNKEVKYTFDNNISVTSLSNHPNFSNVKNDFTIWGKKITASGAEIPVHMRYAVDKKPKRYTTTSGITYYSLNYQPKENENIIERWDWRELIYQMALDYRKNNHNADFLIQVASQNKEEYPTGETGYEQYYTDMEGFWRTLYYPKAQRNKLIVDAKERLWNNLFRLKEEKGYSYILRDEKNNDINSIDTNQIPIQANSSFNTWLDKKSDNETLTFYGEIEDNYFNKSNIKESENNYYSKLEESFKTCLNIKDCPWPISQISSNSFGGRFRRFKTLWMKCRKSKVDQCRLIYLYNNNYILPSSSTKDISTDLLKSEIDKKDTIYDIIVPLVNKNNENLHVNKIEEIDDIVVSSLRFQNVYFNNDILLNSPMDKYFKEKEELIKIRDNATKSINEGHKKALSNLLNSCELEIIKLWNEYDNAINDADSFTYEMDSKDSGIWTNKIFTMPESLLFWIDFLDTDSLDNSSNYLDKNYCELNKYSVPNIGVRPQPINDDQVKGLCFKDTPNVLFISSQDSVKNYPEDEYEGYTFIQVTNQENLFTISTQGKSAREVLDEQMYYHLQYAESISLSSIPIYYLEPNTRISVYDNDSGIYGDYIINKITLPLAYNGTMSIQAFKAPDRLL